MVITGGPIVEALLSNSFLLTSPKLKHYYHSLWNWFLWVVIATIRNLLLVLSVVIYIAARLVLIVQALMALRELSPLD